MTETTEKNPDRNLRLRGGRYYAVKAVPPRFIASLGGKDKLVVSLRTGEIAVARRERDIRLGEWEAMFKAMRGEGAAKGSIFPPHLVPELKNYRQRIRSAEDRGEHDKAAAISVKLIERTEAVEKRNGKAVADAMFLAGVGSTLLSEFVDTWMSEKGYAERTKADFRTAIKQLSRWMTKNGMAQVVCSIDYDNAAKFKLEAFDKVHAKTANKLLSGLRSYWKWLQKHRKVTDNPWIGLSFPKKRVARHERERPFWDDEILRLFNNNPDQLMRDAMAIAALSALRLEEMFDLRIEDCKNGVFWVRRGKTEASERMVPIHSDLRSIVAARCAGKADNEYLLHEGKPTGWDGARSMSFSKRFATYRRACSVDQQMQGHRRSKVNWHSWRRWFITQADRKQHRREDIERTVGHKVQGVALTVYSWGVTIDELSPVVESVKLPSDAMLDGMARPHRPASPKLKRKAVLRSVQITKPAKRDVGKTTRDTE
jgi:site-specific recombinase XerC